MREKIKSELELELINACNSLSKLNYASNRTCAGCEARKLASRRRA
jgi:hypothetical protein